MYRGGGVQNQAKKKSKNAFRPVPVPKPTFPGLEMPEINPSQILRNWVCENWVCQFLIGVSVFAVEFLWCWSLEMPQEPSSRPQPQYRIKFLDPRMQDFYPADLKFRLTLDKQSFRSLGLSCKKKTPQERRRFWQRPVLPFSFSLFGVLFWADFAHKGGVYARQGANDSVLARNHAPRQASGSPTWIFGMGQWSHLSVLAPGKKRLTSLGFRFLCEIPCPIVVTGHFPSMPWPVATWDWYWKDAHELCLWVPPDPWVPFLDSPIRLGLPKSVY